MFWRCPNTIRSWSDHKFKFSDRISIRIGTSTRSATLRYANLSVRRGNWSPLQQKAPIAQSELLGSRSSSQCRLRNLIREHFHESSWIKSRLRLLYVSLIIGSNQTSRDFWTSVQTAVRIATPLSCTSSQYIELFWDGPHCLKSLVICDLNHKLQSQSHRAIWSS